MWRNPKNRFYFKAVALGIFFAFTAPRACAAPDESCRYHLNPSEHWSEPTEAEWTYTTADVRSGIINIYVHAPLDVLEATLYMAGYVDADPAGVKEKLEYVASAATTEASTLVSKTESLEKAKDLLLKATDVQHLRNSVEETVQQMSVSTEYVCGEPQIAAFEEDNQIFAGRHHLRIFDLHRIDESGTPVYAISAIRDAHITIDKTQAQTLFLYHAIDPNTDLERDKLLSDIDSSLGPGPTIVRRIDLNLSFSSAPPKDGAVSDDKIAKEIWLQ